LIFFTFIRNPAQIYTVQASIVVDGVIPKPLGPPLNPALDEFDNKAQVRCVY